jgi:hypothetical protein
MLGKVLKVSGWEEHKGEQHTDVGWRNMTMTPTPVTVEEADGIFGRLGLGGAF